MHLGVRWISRRIAFLALVLFAVAMLSAACGDDDDDDDGGATTPPAAAADGGNAPVALTIGSVLPETGTLGPLGIPIIAGVALAVAEGAWASLRASMRRAYSAAWPASWGSSIASPPARATAPA